MILPLALVCKCKQGGLMILTSYHRAWLSAHPFRSEAWLIARLEDGFQVHHADGNHSNDDPANLILMDGDDHMRLHDRPMERRSIVELQRRGIARAKAAGKYKGGPKRVAANQTHALELIAGGLTITEAAKAAGIARASVYRALPPEKNSMLREK